LSAAALLAASLLPVAAPADAARAARQALDSSLEPSLVAVRGGCFVMGTPEHDPAREFDERRHEVCVQDFLIGRHEVTFAEYDRFAASTGRPLPSDEGWGRGRQPVINVSWEEATAFAAWLSRTTGKGYRLPTEAEWEYACRGGGREQRFCGADEPNPLACYADNCRGRAHPVGSRPANTLGIHDMSGNVGEWTCSAYDKGYRGGETRCVPPGSVRPDATLVARGGSWLDDPRYVRGSSRDGGYHAFRAVTLGFRLVMEPPTAVAGSE
jgi:formylglycine-generating enzyme required for sulfatase activity